MAQTGEGRQVPGATPQVLTFGSPSVGEILAERYQLEGHVGNDSLGRQLYRGIDVILRRPVAVVLRYPGGESAGEMLAAAVAASRIVHPHLVGVYDAIDEGERAYVVREWVDGIALRELVASEGPLDAFRAVTVGWAVTDAVAALHATGMAHGNIHPGTVLIANDGRVVLTDARADVTATPESDIRAIGAVLYCALTGYWPHAEAGPTSVPDAVRDSSGALAAPRQVRAGVPAHLDALVADLLNPNLPLPAADVLAAELARLGQGEEDAGYGGQDALGFTAFESATDTPAPPRAAGRKLATGVILLLVLALAGTLAAARVLGGANKPDATSGGGTPTNTTTPTRGPTGQPTVLKIGANQVRIVDPKGDRGKEFSNADKVVDGNATTSWRSDHYNGRADFGGLKKGMGVWVDLGEAKRVASVQVEFGWPHASGELRGGDADPGSSATGDQQVADQYKLIGEPKSDMQSTAIFGGSPDQPVRYLLVWITKLPVDPSDSQGRYQVSISEITVRVQ